MVNLHEEIRANKRKSIFILLTFFIFTGILFAIAVGLFTLGSIQNGDYTPFFTYYFMSLFILVLYIFYFLNQGEKMILKVTGAKEVSRKDYPYLYHTTEALSIAAGMRVSPKCYVIKDTALNAYATGFKPEKSYIVVTTGLLDKLNRQEIEGVLAHEMSHIKNEDIKLMLYMAGLIGVFTMIGTFAYYSMFMSSGGRDDNKGKIIALVIWILFSVIGVLFATLFRLYLSRKREYLADSSGALLTRYPEGLASALEKIKGDQDPLVDKANKATAHLFISTPFRKKASFFSGLFSTHPPIDLRIAKLRGKRV